MEKVFVMFLTILMFGIGFKNFADTTSGQVDQIEVKTNQVGSVTQVILNVTLVGFGLTKWTLCIGINDSDYWDLLKSYQAQFLAAKANGVPVAITHDSNRNIQGVVQ